MVNGVTTLQDNTTPHTAWQTQQWFQRYGLEMMQHPAHSLQLTPSHLQPFRLLKPLLSGRRLVEDDDDDDNGVAAVKTWLQALDQHFFGMAAMH